MQEIQNSKSLEFERSNTSTIRKLKQSGEQNPFQIQFTIFDLSRGGGAKVQDW